MLCGNICAIICICMYCMYLYLHTCTNVCIYSTVFDESATSFASINAYYFCVWDLKQFYTWCFQERVLASFLIELCATLYISLWLVWVCIVLTSLQSKVTYFTVDGLHPCNRLFKCHVYRPPNSYLCAVSPKEKTL